jgi:hypothetical protein
MKYRDGINQEISIGEAFLKKEHCDPAGASLAWLFGQRGSIERLSLYLIAGQLWLEVSWQ